MGALVANNNRKCKVCGEAYEYCPSCYKDRGRETWHIMFHEENCRNIFQICIDDFLEKTTREQTIELLSSCDLTQLENFAEDLKSQIKDILKSKLQTEPIIEKHVHIDEQEVLVEQKPTTNIFSNKKKKK